MYESPVSVLVVKCNRPKSGTSLARFTVYHSGIKISFGKLTVNGAVEFALANQEFLPFAEYDEARALYSHGAWDINELAAWITDLSLCDQLSGLAATATVSA